jgi:hypothetical protein
MIRRFLGSVWEGLRLRRRLADLGVSMVPLETFDEEFMRIYRACAPFSMASIERLYAVYQAVRHVVDHEVPGDVVECGVWRGGSSMCAAMTLLARGAVDRRLWLYDTFAGMTEPSAEDVNYVGVDARATWRRAQRSDHNRWCYGSLDDVRANLRSTAYPGDRVAYVQGPVEETLPRTAPDSIALLRLDTDWYQSTRHELEHLYPRLSPFGVLIIDDYGFWKGARKAVDEYFAARTPLLLARSDNTGRMAIKLPEPASGGGDAPQPSRTTS